MASAFNLSGMSETELTDLIEAANMQRNSLRVESARERNTADDGAKGQDVNDPDHGAITTPTPHAVRDLAPGEGKTGDRVIGDEFVSDSEAAQRVEDAARRVV